MLLRPWHVCIGTNTSNKTNTEGLDNRGGRNTGRKRGIFLKLPVAITPNYWTRADEDTDVHLVQLTRW